MLKKVWTKASSWKKFLRLSKTPIRGFLLWKNIIKEPKILELRNGDKFLVRPGIPDIQMINEVYMDKEYHQNLKKIKDSAVVIDIGANIGAFTIFVARRFKNIRVYSFEPFPENYKILKSNVKINNLDGRVFPFELGVTKGRGKRKLYFGKKGNATHSIFDKGKNYTEIETTNLDKIFRDNKIKKCSFLKVDCEGAEYEIFLNVSKKLLKNIDSISIEYHPNGDPLKIKKRLEREGFDVNIRESNEKGLGFIHAVNKSF